jgi:outer membrane receptor protein involved in Fe transport
VTLGSIGAWVGNTTHWLPWLRTVVALREENYAGSDHSLVTGFQGSTEKTMLQPKGSLIFGPWQETELYVSGGRGYHSNDLRGVLGTVPSLGLPNPNQTTPFLTKIISEEIGVRSNIIPRTILTAAVFREDFASFLTYDADNGVDDAGPPARLQGIELSAQVRPTEWMELNGDINFTHSRYRVGNLDDYGLSGLYIPNAPSFIGSFGAIIDHFGPWFAGVELRWLGPYPLVSDNSLRASGYREVNLDVGYRINEHIKIQLGIFNLFNSHADSSQYAYEYQVSPSSAPQFGATFHPLEPLSGRLTLTAQF